MPRYRRRPQPKHVPERAEADRADERQRGDGLRRQIDVLRPQADRALAAEQRADELQAGQELMMDMHTRALAAAQHQLERVQEAAEGLRQAEGGAAGEGGSWRGSGQCGGGSDAPFGCHSSSARADVLSLVSAVVIRRDAEFLAQCH